MVSEKHICVHYIILSFIMIILIIIIKRKKHYLEEKEFRYFSRFNYYVFDLLAWDINITSVSNFFNAIIVLL